MITITKAVRRIKKIFKKPMPSSLAIPLSNPHGRGFIDTLEGAPLPVVRILGWFSASTLPVFEVLTHSKKKLLPLSSARLLRADVGELGGECAPFSGFRVDFLIEADDQPQQLLVDGQAVYNFSSADVFGAIQPHYENLFTMDRVLGRESIYGSGPPVDVSLEFKQFAGLAQGHVLDFGCGNGDLVEYLSAQGCQMEGIELDEPRIRNNLKPSVASKITLYDGSQTLPFASASFDCIVSTEVIEHVPDIARYISEFARILKPGGRVFITTPDITSIPSSFAANCVPWHLLELTHINFFTPHSVKKLFASHFDVENLYCLGSGRVNGFFVPGSIGAVLIRRDSADTH